jgi:hypothetical protein
LRTSKDFVIVPVNEIVGRIKAEMDNLWAEIKKNVVVVPYNA